MKPQKMSDYNGSSGLTGTSPLSFSGASLEMGGSPPRFATRPTSSRPTASRWKPIRFAGWPAKLFKTGLVVLAIAAAMVVTIKVRRTPAPAVKAAELEAKFDSAWADSFQTAVAKQQDRIRVIELASTEPKPVVTERVVPPDTPVTAPPVLVVQEDKPVPRHRRFAEARDVCARHNMHRVTTHGGKSWRCRR